MKISVFAGDMRQHYISEMLTSNGFVNEYIYNYIDSDVYIIPTPFSKDGLYINCDFKDPMPILEFVEHIDENSWVFSGGISRAVSNLLHIKTEHVFDYLNDSVIVQYNAGLTANGILHDIIEHTPFSLKNTTVFILGYGNCGKAIANTLRSLVRTIFIYDHTERNLERVIEDGYNEVYYNEIHKYMTRFNVIINTVPQQVLTESHFEEASKNCYFFEVASAPYGLNKKIMEKHSLNLFTCPGLPGKYTPMSAGEIVSEYIIKNLKGTVNIHDS